MKKIEIISLNDEKDFYVLDKDNNVLSYKCNIIHINNHDNNFFATDYVKIKNLIMKGNEILQI